MSLLPIYIYFIAFCFLTSLFTLNKNGNPYYLKYFSIFLLLTLVIESSSFYLWYMGKTNAKLYSYFTIFEFSFYLFILRLIIENKRVRKIIGYSLMSYLVVSLFNILFIQTEGFHSITYSLGCLLIVSFCIYYFFELFQSTHSVNLAREPAFWICSGLLFFYTCTFPLMGLWNHLHGLPGIILRNLFAVLQVLNVLLYSLFSIAFLCRIRFLKVRTAL